MLQFLKALIWETSPWATSDPSPSIGEAKEVSAQNLEAGILIQNILKIHKKLSVLHDLTPSAHINELFGELVSMCAETRSEAVTRKVIDSQMIQDKLHSLRQICAQAECELESYWAEIIVGCENSSGDEAFQRLTEFPYFSNYVDLTRMELSAIFSVDPELTQQEELKIAFLGSGPLPLTSLCLCDGFENHGRGRRMTVLNIDYELEAISQSRVLCAKLGKRAEGMRFLHAEAGSCDLQKFDVVYLAALVGHTQEEKERLLLAIVENMKVGGLLVIRSAERLRKVLYPEFDPTTEKVLECLEICLAVHPYNHVVNSVIIGRVRPKVQNTDTSDTYQ